MNRPLIRGVLGLAIALTGPQICLSLEATFLDYEAFAPPAQTQPSPRFLSLANKVFFPNGWGLAAYASRTPLLQEVEHLRHWVETAVQRHGFIHLVLGDRCTTRFQEAAFQQVARSTLFVDSALEPTDAFITFPNTFGVSGTVSDFLNFVQRNETVYPTLKEKISLVFDDWSLILGEQTNQVLAPFHYLKVPEKMDILESLLTNNGRIFMASGPLTAEHANSWSWDFTLRLCLPNVRRQPWLAWEAPAITDESFFSSVPTWVLSPREAVTEALRTSPNEQGFDALDRHMGSLDYLSDLKTFFFADGCFGDRFIMLERRTVEETSEENDS